MLSRDFSTTLLTFWLPIKASGGGGGGRGKRR